MTASTPTTSAPVRASDDPLVSFLPDVPKRPDVTELNAGTLSPTPLPTQAAVARLREHQASSPSDFFFYQTPRLLNAAREALANFLNASSADVFLLPNVTTAMNIAMQSIRFRPGDEIVTTDHEYGAVSYLIDWIAARDGAIVKRITLPYRTERPAEIVEAFARAMTRRTKLVTFCHVTSPTALTLPAREICAIARAGGAISIIDGAHAPGMVPTDLQAIGADAYGANCHKWMMAPCGSGFLHVGPRIKPLLEPLLRGWGECGFDRQCADEAMNLAPGNLQFGSTRLHYRLEYHGVADRTPMLVLPDVVAYLNKLGPDNMARRVRNLSDQARSELARVGLQSASPTNPGLRGAMTIFDLTDEQAAKIQQHLWPTHKVLAPVTHCAGRQFLRVSTAWFNTPEEIARLAWAVRKSIE